MTTENELILLRQIEQLTNKLLSSDDPLMTSQYRLLHDRVRGLITVIVASPQDMSSGQS